MFGVDFHPELSYFWSPHLPPFDGHAQCPTLKDCKPLVPRLILSPSPCASPPEHVWIDLNGVIVTALPLSSVFGKSDANGGRERREKAE